MARRALITGITGQDGFYLAELLLRDGYQVCGMLRPGGEPDFERIAPLTDRITFLEGVLTDQDSVTRLVERPRRTNFITSPGTVLCPTVGSTPRKRPT